AAILALMVPFAVYYSFGVSAETPSYVATVIFLYGWLRWRATSERELLSWPICISMAGLFGLLLCRPNVLILVGVAVMAYAGMFWMERSFTGAATAKRFAILAACVGIATVILVSSFLRLLPGKRGVSLQASNLGEAIFLSNFQFRTELFDWRFW